MLQVQKEKIPWWFAFTIVAGGAYCTANFVKGAYHIRDEEVRSTKGDVIGYWVGAYFGVIILLLIIVAVSRWIKNRRAIKNVEDSLSSELLARPEVIDFYNNTIRAWSERNVPTSFAAQIPHSMNVSFTDFVRQYPPVPKSALHVMFTEFHPRRDEFLLDLGNEPFHKSNPGWSVVTNKRLIQRDGATGRFREVLLAEVYKLLSSYSKRDCNVK